MADYNRALALDPNDTILYVSVGALLANQGKLGDALPYFEQAARLGDPTGASYAARSRKVLGREPAPPVDPAQQSFDAFQQAASPEAMRQAAARFPMLLQAEFMARIEQAIVQQVSSAQRPAFRQKLAWLQQIAAEQP